MIEALIAGERDPRVLADLAKARLRVKHAALIDALTGRFDDHRAEIAALLLEQIDALSAQIEHLDARIEQLIADIPAAQAPRPGSAQDSHAARVPLDAVDRLDEVTGIGRHAAQVIIAEVGLAMAVFCDRRAPGVLVQDRAADRQVRSQVPPKQNRQGQPLPQKRARRSGRFRRAHQHLPRRPLPPPGPPHRQAESPGRRR
jgi:hypothetical protein